MINPGHEFGQILGNQSQQEMLQQKMQMDALRRQLTPGKGGDAKLKEACQGFEAIFINKLWQQMRSTVPKEGYLHSREEDQYLSMFDQEFSKKMAENGGIGLGDMLYKQLKEQTSSASRYTAPSRAETPMPVKPLKPEAAEKAPAAKQEEAFSLDGLYSPMDGTEGEPKAADAPADKPPVGNAEESGNLGNNTSNSETIPNALGQSQAHPTTRQASNAPAGISEASDETIMQQVEALAATVRQMGRAAGPKVDPVKPAAVEVERVSLNDENPRELMRWPVLGEVSSGFGDRKDPFTGRPSWHAGIDIQADVDTPVRACWDGKVIFAGEKDGYGKAIILEHSGGWRSIYGHNNDIDIELGQMVRAGQDIATVGNTGRSTGPHLHFELRHKGLAWDPQQIQDRLTAGLPIGRNSA